MRNRYVKKCMCECNPVVTKKTAVLHKSVLDVEILVTCAGCEKPYKEVVGKRTPMENPDILEKIVEVNGHDGPSVDPDETGVEDESIGTGELQQETESIKGSGPEEKSTAIAPEEKTEKVEPKDPERDSDESPEKDPVEKEETPRHGRPIGTATRDKDIDKPVYEKTTEKALEDSGVPKEDLF